MALGKIDVANGALIKLGTSTPLVSLGDGTKPANLCKNRIEPCRLALLRFHTWKFAKARTTLASLATTPEFTWSYQFNLPSNFLRIVAVDDGDTPYELEGGKILADETSLELVYVSDPGADDFSKYDPLFIECFSLWLANDICMALTSETGIKDRVYKELQIALGRARFADSTDQGGAEIRADDWINSRRGSSSVLPERVF